MVSFTGIVSGPGLGILAAMLNAAWNTRIDADTMRSRLSSGLPFAIAHDDATAEDCECLGSLGLAANGNVPVGLIETIDILSSGSYANVPATYDVLTNNGCWRRKLDGSDTLILVDVTLLPSRRGGDLGCALMGHALRAIARDTGYSYVWTYTPDIEKVKRWHAGLGAVDTHHVLPCARPFYSVPSVNLMDYSAYVASLRK